MRKRERNERRAEVGDLFGTARRYLFALHTGTGKRISSREFHALSGEGWGEREGYVLMSTKVSRSKSSPFLVDPQPEQPLGNYRGKNGLLAGEPPTDEPEKPDNGYGLLAGEPPADEPEKPDNGYGLLAGEPSDADAKSGGELLDFLPDVVVGGGGDDGSAAGALNEDEVHIGALGASGRGGHDSSPSVSSPDHPKGDGCTLQHGKKLGKLATGLVCGLLCLPCLGGEQRVDKRVEQLPVLRRELRVQRCGGFANVPAQSGSEIGEALGSPVLVQFAPHSGDQLLQRPGRVPSDGGGGVAELVPAFEPAHVQVDGEGDDSGDDGPKTHAWNVHPFSSYLTWFLSLFATCVASAVLVCTAFHWFVTRRDERKR